jgi:hypothetical protein
MAAAPRKRVCTLCGGTVVAATAGTVHAPPSPAKPTPEMLTMAKDGEPEGTRCRLCGSVPAADVKFRSNTGMVLMWQMKTYPGPFCRDCGTATFRRAMNHTLMLGWFGLISFFANLVFVAMNLAGRAKLAVLGAPTRGTKIPLPKGRSLFRQAGVYVAVLAVGAAGAYGVWRFSPHKVATADLAGRCVNFDTNIEGQRLIARRLPPCSSDHDGKVLAVVGSKTDCPAATTSYFVGRTTGSVICVDESS